MQVLRFITIAGISCGSLNNLKAAHPPSSASLWEKSFEKLGVFTYLPAVKHFWVTLQNQKLVICPEGQRSFIKEGALDERSFNPSFPSLSKSEGIRFGTFLDPKTLLYVRAGFEKNTLKARAPSPWDNTGWATPSPGHSLNPGLGFEWKKGGFSISGEYRASIQPFSLKTNDILNVGRADKKISNSVLVSARYKLGKEPALKKEKKSSLSRK